MDKSVMSVRMQKWVGIIQNTVNSGLTKNEYCARNGIDRSQFFHWQKRIREYVLKQNPGLALPPSRGHMQQIREVNSQVIASLPVFCELKPKEELPAVPVVQPEPTAPVVLAVAAFSAGVMVQFGQFQIYVNESASEKTLRLVFSVIQHV